MDKTDNKKQKKERKREKKNKRKAEQRKKAEERIEKGTKRYTKNYTNTHIRKKIQNFVVEGKLAIWTLIIGCFFIAVSFVITYIDIHRAREIPFNNFSDNIDDTIYSVVINEKPIEIRELGDYGRYYDIKSGNAHING